MAYVVNVSSIRGISQFVFNSGSFIDLGNIMIAKRGLDLTRRFYQMLSLSGSGSTVYDGWYAPTAWTFVGRPDTPADLGVGGAQGYTFRAYPFEFDPANPATSSPWHNIIYENFSEAYFAGMRSLHVNFPFGDAFNNNTWLMHPLDQLFGTTGFSTIYTRAGACGMTCYNSTTLPEWCPARVKGFTGAIKQLLEGNMVPGATGRAGLTEYCDVMIYGAGCNGWQSYRDFMHAWWNNAAATNSARDAALLARLDQMVDFYVSCKASTDNKGILSFAIDSDSLSATPSTIQLYRSLSDYKSDVCELADWYFRNKLADRGIPCFTEARQEVRINTAITTSNLYASGFTSGTKGATVDTGYAANHSFWTSDENYLWYSDPTISAALGDNNFANAISNTTNSWTHRLGGSYLTTGERLPWGMTTIVTHAGVTLDLNLMGQTGSGVHTNNVYTPHYAMSYFYAGADICMDWYSRGGLTYGSDTWAARRKFNAFSTLSFDPGAIAGWNILSPGLTGFNDGTRTPLGGGFTGTYRWWRHAINPFTTPMPIFNPIGFTTSAQSKSSLGFPGIAYTGGYWTDSTLGSNSKDWFNTNMRGTTFGDQLAIFKDIAKRLTPKDSVAPPWIGSGPIPTALFYTSASDDYWNNTIDSITR